MRIPENNSLKNEIEEIVELCEKAVPEYGEKASYFGTGASEQEMEEWETKNGVKIPESYREWLRFSANCQIRQTLASFCAPGYFNSEIVPQDLVVIGHLIGDGEVLCFSKASGNFVRYFEGKVEEEFEDFREMLNEIIRMLRGRRSVSVEEKMLMLERLEKIRKRKGKIVETTDAR